MAVPHAADDGVGMTAGTWGRSPPRDGAWRAVEKDQGPDSYRREYSDIQNILTEARLNVADEVNNSYKYGDAKMVINSDLEKSFLQKSFMRILDYIMQAGKPSIRAQNRNTAEAHRQGTGNTTGSWTQSRKPSAHVVRQARSESEDHRNKQYHRKLCQSKLGQYQEITIKSHIRSREQGQDKLGLNRSEMRELGRHGRELEVNFCFLVLPYNSAIDICQQGLKVNNTPSKHLGNPLMGVYLFRHIDVALASSKQKNDKSDTVLVFKVLFGKVKKVQPNVTLNKPALDPSPNSDSHMSKKAPALNDPFDEQVANSLSRMTKIHDTYVNNESNISSEVQVNFSCDSQTKSTFRDNGKVTPPCKVDVSFCNADLLLKPVQTKLLGSITKMAAPLQDNDALAVNCTEVDKNQNFGMTAEESSCIQYLGNRIDWKSLFGMETSEILSEEMKHCKGGTQLYQYKAKTEKEPGGLRIFPDMQIIITNNCKSFENSASIHSIYTNTPIEFQTFEKKISEYKNEPSDDQITDGHVHVSNKVSIQSPKAYKSRPNRISNKVHQVQLNTEETIQPKTNNEPDGKEITSKRRTKFNRKLAHIASEYKHSDNTVKQQRLNNKNVHRLVFKASVGRIKKFSQSEENIKSVLSMLSDEATLCKSKRISKKLDRAILHLRKAHKRVQKSLQLVKRRNKTNPQNGEVITVQRTNSMHSNVTKHTETCDDTEDRIKTVPNNAAIEKSSNHISQTCTYVISEGSQPPQSSKEKLPTLSIPEVPENKQHSNTVRTPIRTSQKGHNAMGQRQLNEVGDTSEGKLLNDVGLSQTKALPVYKMTKLAMKDMTYNNQLLARDESVHTKQNAPLNSEQNSVSLVKELSRLLQKVDETDSLKSLREYKLTCKKMFPTVIKTFEKKQKCSYADVITDQKLLTNGNIKVAFKCVLKPCAIEAFIELQMMMETKQFIDNRIHYLQRQPTFRSLLWYDSSLYGELIAGESGYQQQSPLYRTFQEKLKLYPLNTLQNHYQQLSELLCGIHENRSSYYVFLKYRREIEECEAVLKNCCDLPEFSLSLPLTCGVHIGDTIDDLETLQKSTLELIKTYANSPRCDPGKREHALCLLEVISAKIIFIKTSESITMQLSLFGIEHLLFNAAKKLVLRQQSNYSEQKKLSSFTKEFILTINHYALSKLYELYGTPNEEVMPVQIKDDLNNNSNRDLAFHPQHQMHYVGKIIDQARCAEPHQLKQMILDCREQLNALIKYFQLLQECDADEVLITEKNVLEATQKQDQLVILLKPEAVETYIEVGMMYETIHFLSSLLKKKQDRSRGLLFYDTSLFPNLLHSQHKIVSCLQGNLTSNALDVIESTISEIKSELEIICDYSESVNYTYALQIMTRELSELSELKNFVLESKPTISTYIPLSPFVVSVHYGSTLSELEYNYSQFSDLLGLLMSVPKKDLGRMAHTMKVMKTIELMKNIVLKSNKSAFNVIIYQLYKNNCEQDFIGERDKNSKMTDKLSPRKRANSHTHPDKSDQHLDFSPKKQKVLKYLPSSSATVEHQILAGSPSRQRENMEDTVIQKTADSENDTQDCTEQDPDCSSHKDDNKGEDLSSLQDNIQADLNERNSPSRIPSSSSNNHLGSCAYPWQYSLYFWYQNGSNTSLVTQSYQGVSYNAQRSFPYGETPMFSAENSYAANQAYFANQSQMCPMPGPFGIGTYYNYSAPPSQFPYDASPSTVWSWDSWQ
ncbi:testis-expressed protein 15 [Spea bombifrons]|uniref:testis-expressed protein 15 n=1 Tax=Spea bombifrons TaxID=233779 RepID=UPI00234A6F7C|nr:testis-expressed protein 15 [Spea bombifrons]